MCTVPFYGVTFAADFPFFVSKICFPGRIAPGLPVFHGAFLSFPLLQAEKRPCIGFSRPYTYKTSAACADLAAEGVILGQYSCRKSAEGAPCVFLSTQRQRDCRAGLLGAYSRRIVCPFPCAREILPGHGPPRRSRLIKLCENSNRGAGSAAHCLCWHNKRACPSWACPPDRLYSACK